MSPFDRKAILLALAAVLCWSTVATAFELALRVQSLFQLLLLAHSTTLILMSALLIYQKRLRLSLAELKHHWKSSLLLGLINPILYYLVLFKAYELLPAQVAQPINYSWSLTLSLLSVPVLGHVLTRRDVMSLLLALVGVGLISKGGEASGQPVLISGVALALASTLLWAGYWLVNTRNTRPATEALFHNFLVTWPLALACYAWFDGSWTLTVPALMSGVYVGLFEMGISFLLWLSAMRLISRASLISNLIFLSPPVSLTLIYFVLDEHIGLLTWVGLGVILSAILWQSRQASSGH